MKKKFEGKSLNPMIKPQLSIRKPESGFTLLELMISLAIIGILIFMLMGVLRLGSRAVAAGEKKIETLERARTSLNIINAQIQSLNPLTRAVEGEQKSYFSGNRDSLQFATNYSIWDGESGYVIVSYQVEQDNRGKQVLSATENKIGLENKRTLTLLDSFDKLYFEYFYKAPTDENGQWIDQWTESSFVPEKIKLHMVNGDKDLSLIIPMRAGGAGTGVVAAAPPSPLMKKGSQ
jgi:general secretion pathway protein J